MVKTEKMFDKSIDNRKDVRYNLSIQTVVRNKCSIESGFQYI